MRSLPRKNGRVIVLPAPKPDMSERDRQMRPAISELLQEYYPNLSRIEWRYEDGALSEIKLHFDETRSEGPDAS